MSRELLNQLTEARSKATQGEWIFSHGMSSAGCAITCGDEILAWIKEPNKHSSYEATNTPFIALAANSTLAICEYVEKLEAENKALKQSETCGYCDFGNKHQEAIYALQREITGLKRDLHQQKGLTAFYQHPLTTENVKGR